jgi:xanthine phosphoribosyltransferase
MQLLHDHILRHGKHLGGGILKVDAFMNHQIDPKVMQEIGSEFAERFAGAKPTKILTAETSGIAPALACGMVMQIPVVFARKHQPITMEADPYRQTATSHTYGNQVELLVSPEYLSKEDRILIIDDFLATARTILVLVKLIHQSGANLVGIGAVIEKSFEGGRALLASLKVPVESLAVIEGFDGERIIFDGQRI